MDTTEVSYCHLSFDRTSMRSWWNTNWTCYCIPSKSEKIINTTEPRRGSVFQSNIKINIRYIVDPIFYLGHLLKIGRAHV